MGETPNLAARLQALAQAGEIVIAGSTRELVGDAFELEDLGWRHLEGTSGPSDPLLPFHGNLLQAAIATGSPVQPVALRYADRLSPISPSALWVGETTLARTLWLLACGDELVAHLCVLPAQQCTHADRRLLAQALRMDIDAALQAIDARFQSP